MPSSSMKKSIRINAGLGIPRIVPWRDWDEWYRVKGLLFSQEPSLRAQGVQHVAVWLSRGHIPHTVETTSQLVEVRLNDVGAMEGGPAMNAVRRSEEELRLIYSAVVLRAVNGLTGQEQKSTHPVSVASLAEVIGLPSWIVDIRHEAAHKQLPGIVPLRLASDCLMDYLVRYYWAPQADHLEFLWGAFDKLISRYKAESESDAPLPSNSSPGDAGQGRRDRPASAAPAPNKKRRTGTSWGSGSSESPAPVQDNDCARCHEWGVAGGSYTSSKSAARAAAAAMEVAAKEIFNSASPSVLSWTLISLLADGGVGAGNGANGIARVRSRGQGHLLPRSCDRYPTPGTPGVDAQDVGRRITSRWAALLGVFHSKWRGFGAALLVRLVEALLNNAASPAPLLPPPPPNATAHPSGAGASSSGDAGGGGAGEGGGLERQAAFIEVWVRYLLSRRWHLRGSDARIRSSLRETAVDAGLSPAFCDQKEASWKDQESTWADKPAPFSVLHAAFFPVRELLERCHRSLETLPVVGAPAGTPAPPTSAAFAARIHGDDGINTAGENTPAPPATHAHDASVGKAHWARAGIGAVCLALAEALPGEAVTSANEDTAAAAAPAAAAASSAQPAVAAAAGDEAGAEGGATGDQSPSSVRQEVGSIASGGVGDGAVVSGQDGGDIGGGGDGEERVKSAESTTAAAAAAAAAAGSTTMMDLDAFERLLAADGSLPPCPAVSREGGGSIPPASAGAVDDADACVVEAARGSGLNGGAPVEVVGVGRAAAADGDSGAWEVVETWTPCAIGTLPGWSAGHL